MKAYQGSSGPFFMKKKNVIPLSYVFFFIVHSFWTSIYIVIQSVAWSVTLSEVSLTSTVV